MPSLRTLYEEVQAKRLSVKVIVAGHLLNPRPREISYDFSFGEVPTCDMTLRNQPIPIWLKRNATVQVYVGFNDVLTMTFNGYVSEISVYHDGVHVGCVGSMSKLDSPYQRFIMDLDGSNTVEQELQVILSLAGVTNYSMNLRGPMDENVEVPWRPILTTYAVEGPVNVEMSSFLEGINKLLEPFNSPAYEMPSGQIRLERRDPIPADSFFREYFSEVVHGPVSSRPAGVSNSNAYARIRSANFRDLYNEVANRVFVRGRQVTSIGPEGEQNKDVIETAADAASPWIDPNFPGFVDYVYSNELLDNTALVAQVALRYLELMNRLNTTGSVTIEGDPEIFLGATVFIRDPEFTGVVAPFFVNGYSCTISESDFQTSLELLGGEFAGTAGMLEPFADFIWTNHYVAIAPGVVDSNGNAVTNIGAKAIQFVPGEDGQRVIITFDAGVSRDFDGFIDHTKNEWSSSAGHSQIGGRRWTVPFDPDESGSVDVTLRVYDNTGRWDEITKTVLINTFAPFDGYATSDDSADGGGVEYNNNVVGISEEENTLVFSEDGGETWKTIDLGELGLEGQVIEISAEPELADACEFVVLAGSTRGEIIKGTGPDFEDLAIVFQVPTLPTEYPVRILELASEPVSEEPIFYIDGEDPPNTIVYWARAGVPALNGAVDMDEMVSEAIDIAEDAISGKYLLPENWAGTTVGFEVNSEPDGTGDWVPTMFFQTVEPDKEYKIPSAFFGDEEIASFRITSDMEESGDVRWYQVTEDEEAIEISVWKSEDGGTTWEQTSEDLFPVMMEEDVDPESGTTDRSEEEEAMEGGGDGKPDTTDLEMQCEEFDETSTVKHEDGLYGVYLAECGGNIYKTVNNGEAWGPLPDLPIPVSNFALVPCAIRVPAVELYGIFEGEDPESLGIDSVSPLAIENESSVTITGFGFGAEKGGGKIEITTDSEYGNGTIEEQTVVSWDNDSVTITVSKGDLPTGTVYVFLTNNLGATSTGIALMLS